MFEFQWDEAKNRSNVEKHGIAFEDVRPLFDAREIALKLVQGAEEIRSVAAVRVNVRILTVVFVTRANAIRIISARRASRAERRNYRQLYGG